MACQSPRLFRHRRTLQYWIANCQQWACRHCIHQVARRWQAVAAIRAILWPPMEPGMWEYIGLLPWHEQLTWTWPDGAGKAVPDVAPTG